MTVHAQLPGIAATFVELPYIIVAKIKLSIFNLLRCSGRFPLQTTTIRCEIGAMERSYGWRTDM